MNRGFMSSKSEKQAWQQQTSTVMYENPWIKVRHDTVLTPANTEGIYGVVHFKNHAVGILPIDECGYTWLVRQTRYVCGKGSWEIPEGGCPKNESTLEAAKRELQEETGLSAENWKLWLSMDLSNSVTDEQATVYLAQGLTQGELELEDTEDIEVLRLPLKQAIAMVMDGAITDAISIAALLKAALSDEF